MMFVALAIQGAGKTHPLFPRTEDDLDVPAASVEVRHCLRIHLFGRDIGRDKVPAAPLLLRGGEGMAPFMGIFCHFAKVLFGDLGLCRDRHKARGLGSFAKGDLHIDGRGLVHDHGCLRRGAKPLECRQIFYVQFTQCCFLIDYGVEVMKRKHLLVLLAGSLISPLSAHKVAPGGKKECKVQIAILLDTSGSMNGLIEQTKTQLWKVVNTFIEAKKAGQVPFVEVALYEYGNSRLDHKAHWVRQIQPLTRDLDQVSEDLFGLTTSGGDEFCGAVITRATADLKWDPSPQVYKAIFIAGNEPFNQGPIQPQEACREAIGKGVVVNTIHCGAENVGLSGGWNTGQLIAEGSFLVINHNAAVAHISAPQDAQIMKLNTAINGTYIPYGKIGATKKNQQIEQDGNSVKKEKAGAHVQRAVTKATSNYWNASWDLCDACHAGTVDWTKVKAADLPEAMRKLDIEGRKKYVAEHQAKRDALRKKIQELNKARTAFVARKGKELAQENTLDFAVAKTVREQAMKKGYQFEEK